MTPVAVDVTPAEEVRQIDPRHWFAERDIKGGAVRCRKLHARKLRVIDNTAGAMEIAVGAIDRAP